MVLDCVLVGIFPIVPSPVDCDSDGDGIEDGWESIHQMDPLNSSDAGDDPDGDGLSNLDEYLRGHDPSDPESPAATPDSNVLLVSAVLPTSRSVQVGDTATAFGMIINAGTVEGIECRIVPPLDVAADFFYQTTNPATNELSNSRNQSIDIGPGNMIQTFVFGFTPRLEISSTALEIGFRCTNANDAAVVTGVNTLRLSASSNPVPDLVALAATIANDGIVHINPVIGAGAFIVATVNVGSSASMTVTADTNDVDLPVTIGVCETDPLTAVCINPVVPTLGSVVTHVESAATPTFGVFVSSTEYMGLDPARARVFLRFRDAEGEIRGSTSVAIQSD